MAADVLILTSRPDAAAAWRSALAERGYQAALAPWQAGHWLERDDVAEASVVVLHSERVDDVELAEIRALRERGSLLGVVIIGHGDIESRVRALNAGADACLAADASTQEVVARLVALLRRMPLGEHGITFSEGELSLDLRSRAASYRGRRLNISQYEYRVLRELALQVMECRSTSAAAAGDDRLTEALHKLDYFASHLERSQVPDRTKPTAQQQVPHPGPAGTARTEAGREDEPSR